MSSKEIIAISSSDEEPDYMSDEFLKQCTGNDVRPSLIHNREVKRKNDILIRQQERNKTRQELENARVRSLEESLKVPVSNDNKGFQMLVKMGYKPGSSIGSDPAQSGIKEPISIELKQSRGGLGFKRKCKEEGIKKTILETPDPEEFRLRKHAATKMRETAGDLRKAQFSCQTLDQEAGLKNPIQSWYWQKQKPKENAEKGSCVEDLDDLKELEPEVPHKKCKVATGEDSDLDDSSSTDSDEDEDIPDEQKLDRIFTYLRNTYFYCLWCGAKFNDSSDLNACCPGLNKDDH